MRFETGNASGGASVWPAPQLRQLDSGEVRADAFAGAGLRHLVAVDLQAAHAHDAALRKKLELLLARQGSGDEAPRHHRSEAGDRERPVDRKPRRTAILAGAGALRERGERRLESVEPLAGTRRDG